MVMGTKKSQKPDLRGGRRENAGRKPTWNNKDTITIRVPKLIATQVMLLARRLDSGENIELDTKSKSPVNEFVIKSNFGDYEIVTKTELENHEIIIQSNIGSREGKSDFVTESIPSYSQAIEIAKKILKHKKSARISIAKIISKIYEQTLSPDDLKS
ncbi:MAG: hypothetical protein KME54_17590 [Tolypothrix brevis GSE-NOS-MK-07-07A]|jgi:hypothetical protein|nr:hypothetical protein [Tolypothrix brevis GSE-NOS-MK-07-07A]